MYEFKQAKPILYVSEVYKILKCIPMGKRKGILGISADREKYNGKNERGLSMAWGR